MSDDTPSSMSSPPKLPHAPPSHPNPGGLQHLSLTGTAWFDPEPDAPANEDVDNEVPEGEQEDDNYDVMAPADEEEEIIGNEAAEDAPMKT